MAIVMRAVRGQDGTDFEAFVYDGTIRAGDALFSGTFQRTETWVTISAPGRTVSTYAYESVGDLTFLGIHRATDDLLNSDLHSATIALEQIVV